MTTRPFVRPVVFLDFDDVLVVSREYTSYQVIMTFKSRDLDGWPELWAGLVLPEARTGLAALFAEYQPEFVISSSWSKYLTKDQLQEMCRRTGLTFVADNLHEHWTTPKGTGSARLTEIEDWITKYGNAGQPLLILDDLESGWSLQESHLDDAGYVVLCEPWAGFIGELQTKARQLLKDQIARRKALLRGN